MKKTKYILNILVLVAAQACAQTDSTYKHFIDSILLDRRWNKVEKIKTEIENIKTRFFFRKSDDQLQMIEVSEIINNERWICNYYFINDKFVKINRWNNRIPGDIKRAVSNYYFLNNELIFKEEQNTRIPDLQSHLMRIALLRRNAPRKN